MADGSHENDVATTVAQPLDSIASSALLQTLSDTSTETCVICLDHITQKAIARPCRHDQFDFHCLGTWLQRQQVCPLCKGHVDSVRFGINEENKQGSQIFYLPEPELPPPGRQSVASPSASFDRRARFATLHSRNTRRHRSTRARNDGPNDTGTLDFRKQVYQRRLYSLHVGTNRLSRYRNLTPDSFAKDQPWQSRARMWIRRELGVFDFLNSASTVDSPGNSGSSSTADRRAGNAGFLLEYIIAILKSIDLKGSSGQAEELLKDFLGRENARLFLHELESWLRSPYEHLRDWDRAVQYSIPAESGQEGGEAMSRSSSVSVPPRQRPRDHSAATVPEWFSDRFVLQRENHRDRPS
ncbi:hypothetical protein PV08_10382 [Exophiala spinifera]|uniref:RING-type E3 ubiquitin transferase n=1 Tax=Exophiala spinifera TaxID=91928 RepID=A0A0D2AWL6_9EURO|nr:uncharacterized protein PV08_10382 [Exophiala spinifera]KIW11083.1 hypothetical protein PV08_10382 [Exophiala spinifera]